MHICIQVTTQQSTMEHSTYTCMHICMQVTTQQSTMEHSQMLLLEARRAADDLNDANETELAIADHIDELQVIMHTCTCAYARTIHTWPHA